MYLYSWTVNFEACDAIKRVLCMILCFSWTSCLLMFFVLFSYPLLARLNKLSSYNSSCPLIWYPTISLIPHLPVFIWFPGLFMFIQVMCQHQDSLMHAIVLSKISLINHSVEDSSICNCYVCAFKYIYNCSDSGSVLVHFIFLFPPHDTKMLIQWLQENWCNWFRL